MRFLVPLLLLVVPVIEIALFILIGGQIGLGWTLLMILVTAIGGTLLLRAQGFAVMARIRSETQAGRIPGRELAHGLMLLLAGVLLLTPGFFTDAIGFLLFVPPLRDAIYGGLKARLFAVVPGMMGAPFGGAGPLGGGGPFAGGRPFGRDDGVVDLDADEYTAHTPDRATPDRAKTADLPRREPG